MALPVQFMKMGAAMLKPAFVVHLLPYFALLLSGVAFWLSGMA